MRHLGFNSHEKKSSFARKKFGHDDSSYRQPDITLDHRYFPLLFSGHTKRRLLLAGPALEQLVEGSPRLSPYGSPPQKSRGSREKRDSAIWRGSLITDFPEAKSIRRW